MRDTTHPSTTCQSDTLPALSKMTGLGQLPTTKPGPNFTPAGESSPLVYNSNNTIQTGSELTATARLDCVCALSSLLSPYHKKQAHILAANVKKLIGLADHIGQVGMLTLTFEDNVTDHHDAYRRFNSWRTNWLADNPEFRHWLCVKERQRRGSWHYHMIVLVRGDLRAGFDFDAYETWLDRRTLRQQRRCPTGGEYLRQLWAELYDVLPRYGLGRIYSLEPIKSTADGLARYVGKYIGKHLGARIAEDHGVRLVNSSRDWVRNSARFAWVSPNARQWRVKLGRLAERLGIDDMSEFSARFGSRWAYNLADYIAEMPEE